MLLSPLSNRGDTYQKVVNLSVSGIQYPSLTPQFWWKGTLEYIDPNKENYQKFFLLFLSCVASLAHEYEKWGSFDWSASVGLKPMGKTFVSASNYWRVRDFFNGLKEAFEKGDKGDYTESFFKLIGGVSSLGVLITELFNRKVFEGGPVDSIKLGGGIMGATVYMRKSVKGWSELGQKPEESSQVIESAHQNLQVLQNVKDLCGLMMNVTIFVIKVIGLMTLTAPETQYRVIRFIVDYQADCLLGCFTFAMATSLLSHFSEHYMENFIELNKKNDGAEG